MRSRTVCRRGQEKRGPADIWNRLAAANCRHSTRFAAQFRRDRLSPSAVQGKSRVESCMTEKNASHEPSSEASEAPRPSEGGREHTNLGYRYGAIGISAVAAAMRY